MKSENKAIAIICLTRLACTMIAVVLICVSLVFSGCVGDDVAADYNESRMATIDAWGELRERVSDECRNRLDSTIVQETMYFPESCIPGGKYTGCYLAAKNIDLLDDIIFIRADRTELQKLDTAVHEYVHAIDHCVKGNSDIKYADLLAECIAVYLAGEKVPDKCVKLPGDYFHLDNRLWDRYGPDTVEAHGCANLRL